MLKEEIITDWLDAWNCHDLDRIMQHYADDIEFTAQTIVTRWAKADGKLKGKEELRKHFSKGLTLAPNIHFTLEEILFSPNGYAVLYSRENGNRVLDAVELNDEGLAVGSPLIIFINNRSEDATTDNNQSVNSAAAALAG